MIIDSPEHCHDSVPGKKRHGKRFRDPSYSVISLANRLQRPVGLHDWLDGFKYNLGPALDGPSKSDQDGAATASSPGLVWTTLPPSGPLSPLFGLAHRPRPPHLCLAFECVPGGCGMKWFFIAFDLNLQLKQMHPGSRWGLHWLGNTRLGSGERQAGLPQVLDLSTTCNSRLTRSRGPIDVIGGAVPCGVSSRTRGCDAARLKPPSGKTFNSAPQMMPKVSHGSWSGSISGRGY
ncbi:hypothetical protein E2C01_042738 [Portunus trituberculatus]|uniref:Uncharacterized protein n=1 Tax=Portunus trituberculatus TaxID=210409 RepID=A0A5B7FMK0_PORTR|nr:hypothetical protein [Portunus trituberculatus]